MPSVRRAVSAHASYEENPLSLVAHDFAIPYVRSCSTRVIDLLYILDMGLPAGTRRYARGAVSHNNYIRLDLVLDDDIHVCDVFQATE